MISDTSKQLQTALWFQWTQLPRVCISQAAPISKLLLRQTPQIFIDHQWWGISCNVPQLIPALEFQSPGWEAQHWSRALSLPISCCWNSITPLVSLLVFADTAQLMHKRLVGVLPKRCQHSADEHRGLQSSHSEPWPSSKAVKYCKIQVWPPAIWKFQGTRGAAHHT